MRTLSKAEILFFKTLLTDKRSVLSIGQCLVFGSKIIQDLIASTSSIVEAIYTSSLTFKPSKSVRVEYISKDSLERIAPFKSGGDIFAVISLEKLSKRLNHIEKDALNQNIIALEKIQDPGNLGTIIRSAVWFGVTKILLSEDSASVYNSKVIQSSMGAVFSVKVEYVNLKESLLSFKKKGYTTIGGFLDGKPLLMFSKQLALTENTNPSKLILVGGNEGGGISSELGSVIENRVRIEGGGVESLNVATAMAILCYKLLQR